MVVDMKKYPTYTIELYQGSTESIPIAFYSVNGEEKTPIILDYSADVVLTIRDELGMDVLFTLSKSTGEIELGTIVDNEFVADSSGLGDNYAIKITFSSEVTSEFTIPKMVYDLMLVHSEGEKEILLHGVIITQNGVTEYART